MSEIRPINKYRQSKKELTPDDIIDQLNICYRVCHVFTQKEIKAKDKDKEKNKDICECGRSKEEHKFKKEHNGEKWDMMRNTKQEVNSIHGQLRNNAWFVRLALDTPLEKVEKILLDAWKIPKPQFIVSIIGGAKYFKLTDRLETNIINGIVDIAHKSNAWIFTNGYSIGVVQLVGQAINKVKLTHLKKKITAIGVCKWGCIKDVEKITLPKHEEIEQTTTDTINNSSNKKSKTERRKGEWDLEMNHSHYLMLDDGRYQSYDVKDYRTRLAIHMSRLQHENEPGVPVVTVIVEGGKESIVNIYYDLKSNIPVVIINGSGRAADFFNRWLSYTKDLECDDEYQGIVCGIDELTLIDEETSNARSSSSNRNQNDPSNLHSHTTNRAKDHVNSSSRKLSQIFQKYEGQLRKDLVQTIFKNNDEHKDLNRTIDQVMYCLQPAVRSDITVFNLNADTDLTETIFRSICGSRQKLSKRKVEEQNNTNEYNRRKLEKPIHKNVENDKTSSRLRINKKDRTAERSNLLNLAMDWRCIDAARELIFESSLDNILNKNDAFTNALIKDLPAFVYEFLKLGFDPSEIFFPNNTFIKGPNRYEHVLKILYTSDAVNRPKTHLKSFIDVDKATTRRRIDSIDKLNMILKTLIGDYMYKLYFNTLNNEEDHRISWSLMDERNRSLSGNENQPLLKENRTRMKTPYDYIIRDLFLWAILMNYVDMAKVFLSYMKYRICPALIATKIFKEYYKKAAYGDLKDSYKKSAELFEQYAISCLDKCDDYDGDQACEIILQQNELYGYVSCLQVAADAEDKYFIATQCSVQAMNSVWYDKIRSEQNSKRDRLALTIGFVSLGLAAPFVVSYREIKKKPKNNEPTARTLKTNGINYCDPYLLEYSHQPVPEPVYKRYIPKLTKFHLSLPMKFCYHIITYLFFLLLFSYFLLFNFSPPTDETPSIHWTEIFTIIFVSCMLIEEIHYFFTQDSLTFLGKSKNCFRDYFKPMTFFAFILFYIGLIIRFTYIDSEWHFSVARIIWAFDLEIWWLRTLSFIIVVPFLGPHLVAIWKMLKDLLFFTIIIAVVMIGYGVASRSMVYYPVANNFTTEAGGSIDTSFDGRSVFRQVLYPVYYLLYGEFRNELTTLDTIPDAGWSIATHILLAIHMLFVNILLTNLLIAMFSKRFEEVSGDTKNIWHSQQYLFTREYFTRSPFFPPISLVYDIYCICRMTYFFIRHRFLKKNADSKARVFKIIAEKDSTITEWCEFEDNSTYEYAHAEVKALKAGSMKSTHESESNNTDNDKIVVMDNDSNNTDGGLKQVQDDLIKLNSFIGVMKERLEKELKENPRHND